MQARIKVFSIHISSKGLIEYKKNSHKAIMKGQATEQDTRTVSKHVKMSSTSSITKEIHIKTIVTSNYILIKMTKNENLRTRSVRSCSDSALTLCWWECELEHRAAVSDEAERKCSLRPSNAAPREHLPGRHLQVHQSQTHIRQYPKKSKLGNK